MFPDTAILQTGRDVMSNRRATGVVIPVGS